MVVKRRQMPQHRYGMISHISSERDRKSIKN